MKQFTYKDYDIATGIVFTNLCCDMLNRFDIDMFNDASAKPIFEALSDYVGNNIEILEEDKYLCTQSIVSQTVLFVCKPNNC